MNNEHITNLLDQFALKHLDDRELSVIKTHVADCESCRRSFEATKITANLLKIRAAEMVEPPLFFETRVIAAWRERQAKSVTAFWRWWQASNSVVVAIIITVAALLLITLLAPNAPQNMPELAAAPDDYATEEIIFNRNDSSQELTSGQALQIIYEQQK